MGGRHGRHLVTAGTVFVASTWQQIYQVIFGKPKKNVMDHGCHGLCSVGKIWWDLPSLQPHRLGRGRSSSQFLVQFVIEKKSQLKTTAPNAQDSMVSNPPQRSKKSEDHLRKDESSYCGGCVMFQEMRANCPD